jgi:hypothetical protein
MSWTTACGDLEMEKEIYFEVTTPLGVRVRTTKEYWDYIVNIKHRPMKNKENIVKETLLNPDEIYRSKIDQNIHLYYKLFDRIYCAIVKHMGKKGFLITAYPTDKIKEGERIWKR